LPIPRDIDDRSLVQIICNAREESAGSQGQEALLRLREAEDLLVARFNPIVRAFAYRKTSGRLELDDIVNGFWLKTLGGRVLNNYQGHHGATLRTYLLAVLRHHILDEFQRLQHREGVTEPLDAQGEDLPDNSSFTDRVEIAELERIASQLILQALHFLSLCYPKDRLLLELKLKGFPNAAILKDKLLNERDLNEEGLKKRVSRAKRRFRIILQSLCFEKGIAINDLIDHSHEFHSAEPGGLACDP
jgi:RNA polymerase sigma factor (sigma-70 family)